MRISEKTIFKKIAQEVGRDSNCITVNNEKEGVLLNPTVSIVWEYIDGYQSVDSIYQNMLEKYGGDNDPKYIKTILMEAIDILLNYKLIEKNNV